jgi:hypothetical protein
MAYIALGKFSSALEELIFTLANYEQWADEHNGNSTDWDLYFWALAILKPIDISSEATIRKLARQIDPEDGALPDSVYGYWLAMENSQGFATVQKFDSAEALDAAFQELQAAYEAWDNQDDNENTEEA